MITCFIGVGSNLGKRRENISSALNKIKKLKGTKIIKVSKIIETLPQGGPSGQGKFLNAVIKIKTALLPLVLLKELKQIESHLGRINTVRWGPRTIDLDILIYGDKIINRRELKIPHPKMLKRKFVLTPLLQII